MRSWTGDAGLKTAMKRRIYLFRHGKSSWGGSAREDKDRDLNPRGRKAAEKMGEWCAENGVAPDLVLCSTATRTRETLARLLPRLKSAARIAWVTVRPPGRALRSRLFANPVYHYPSFVTES